MTKAAVRSPRALKRPLHRRALALIWALLFLMGTGGEGFGLRPCPHHGGAGSGTEASGDQGAHAGHEAVATHSHAEAGHAGHHTQAPDHSGPCTCGSACQASAGVALPGVTVMQPSVEVVAAMSATILEQGVSIPSRPPHFLPFAQAPPV